LLTACGISYALIALLYYILKDNTPNSNKPIMQLQEEYSSVDVVKYSMPLAFNAVLVWLMGAADQLLIDQYLDRLTLTYYAVAFRMILVTRLITGIIMEYWPRFYFERMANGDQSALRQMRRIFIVFVALISVGTIVFSNLLYTVLGASQYLHVRWMYCILALGEIFRIWSSVNMTYQSYRKNTSINVACLCAIGVIKLTTNFVLIQRYGVMVLLVSNCVAYALYYLCSLYWGIRPEQKYLHQS
jgi:O-antigen/teichoic acid export membrane protein